MFGTNFSGSFCGNIPNNDVATARGDLNAMVTPADRRFSFDFNVIEVDDLLASTSSLTIEDDAWLKALSSDDWETQLGLTASPLMSDSSSLSTLSCSSSNSASASPQPSPVYVSPELPEMQLFPPFDSMFNDGFTSTGLQQVQCPSASTSGSRALLDHNGETLQEDALNWDTSQHTVDGICKAMDSRQHGIPNNDALEGNAPIVHTGVQLQTETEEPIPLLDRTFSPRRAASITKRRLEVLFKDEEVDEEDDFGGTEVQLSRNARIRKSSTNINSKNKTTSGKHASKKRRVQSSTSIDYDSFDDTSDSDSDEERVKKKPAPMSSPNARTTSTTRRITYTDLVSSQHPITRPSITSTFMLPPSDCRSCVGGFARIGDLIRHLKAYHQAHDEDKALACSGCGTQFSRSDALRRHREKGTCKGKKRKRRMRRWEVEAALAMRTERAERGSS
ncbi:uncharacterized protein FOMMEDRAFT_157546 [Fomitiporia mediterranea MF3/22]|uniref:uncharacterized protein n=1 Tax=Fomitiporia mediterranea (strain MF3/22) TaxID=694068 RepID=UPI00044091D5|nr:uncharacterized protein FOMMEDRAFT_157546 [Fomitiporia mediterranea MF3/22]EJD02329.1 hypothetical protein FOMMEDRAFT_157546 [Fomitiporia mediterranea MF3/22]